jgi:hypothetical protein
MPKRIRIGRIRPSTEYLIEIARKLAAEERAWRLALGLPLVGFTRAVRTSQLNRQIGINGKGVTFDSHGQFTSDEIVLKPGQDIIVTAFYIDDRFRRKTLEVTYEGDLERLMASGQRYALVIGIQNYDDKQHWPPLATPLHDARAVADILARDYGFKTEIADPKGAKTNLFLADPGLREIQTALETLRLLLGENDSLLIYYAGHGHYVAQSKDAYWIPKDGKPDDDFSWLPATVLRSKLKQMNARSVLVVTDSCFSGAMKGLGPADLSIFDSERRRALKKASEHPSRLYMSSGAVDPVPDEGGCDKHSVFGCAFLEGLRDMDMSIFSSGDLYVKYVMPRVGGRSDQNPQWARLAGSTPDENSGEFIFARIQAIEMGKAVEAKTPPK